MKFENIPPIKPNRLPKGVAPVKGSVGRRVKRYRVNFVCNQREALTALSKQLGMSRAAVLNFLISTAEKKYCR